MLEDSSHQQTLAQLETWLEPLLADMIGDEGRWITVIERKAAPLRYVQCLTFEGCHSAVVAEAVSDAYLDDGTKLSRYEIGSLRQLGWNLSDSGEGNWQLAHEAPASSVHDLACRMLATLRWAFGCTPDEPCLIKWWESDVRGSDEGPASTPS